MESIRLRAAALTCSCLLGAPLPSFTQSLGDRTAAATASNIATPSLRYLDFSPDQAQTSLKTIRLRAIELAYACRLTDSFSPFAQLDDDTTAAFQSKPATAPSGNQEPSLPDLGFPPNETRGNAQEQARLDKRSHMLKMHQRLGLITTIPLLATLITSTGAGRHSSAAGRDWHAALGGVTTGLYFTTASYAIFAPKVPGTKTRGPIRLHKALAWIHGPGMILTPILGVMAFQQENRGEKVHGIAAAHGAVAWVTAAAFGAAILSVSIKF